MKMFSGNKSKRVYHVAWKQSVNAFHEKDSRQKISFVDVAISGSPSPPSPAREFHFRPFSLWRQLFDIIAGRFFRIFRGSRCLALGVTNARYRQNLRDAIM